MGGTLVESFLGNAAAHPDKLCVASGKTSLTYGEVARRVRTAARTLSAQWGVGRGDRVMISGVPLPDYVIALLAVQYLGAVTVPVDRLARKDTLSALIDYLKPAVFLTEAGDAFPETRKVSLFGLTRSEQAGEIVLPPQCVEREDVAEMLFTTGTTGSPKAVMLAYRSVRAITRNTIAGIGLRADDVVLVPLPLNHSVGMRVLRSALTAGAGIVLQDGFAFAQELEENIVRHRCTGLVCVPASVEIVRRQMRDRFPLTLGRLRYIEFGAGFLSVAMKRKLLAELPHTTLYNTWGSSETGGAIFLDVTGNPDRLESLGRPVEGVEFATLREDGSFGPARDFASAGRMALRGDMRMLGYYKLPEETADALRGDWLVTNDLAYADDDGFVHMLGRADDIINVGGEKVAPVDVENIVGEFDGIRECACIGVEDRMMGQVPVLYYVTDVPGFDQAELERFVARRAERYQLPGHYVRIDALPRNRMGKLDRRAIVKLWEESLRFAGAKRGMDAIEALLTRKSVRDFTDEPVSKEQLETIVRCGIQAPSAHNLQAWRFTVVTQQAVIGRIRELLSGKARDYRAVCHGFNNPAAVILVTNDARNRNAAQDSACAAENMLLAAHALGLGAVWNNAIGSMKEDADVRKVLDELNVPARHLPWLLILLGHPLDAGQAAPRRRTDVVTWV